MSVNVGIVYKSGKSLLGLIEMPFMAKQNFLILTNEKNGNDRAPDFNAMVRVGGKFTQLGGIWNKVADNDNKTQYKELTIEHPLSPSGRIWLKMFSVKEATKYKDSTGVEREVIYNIVYSAPRANRGSDNFQAGGEMNADPSGEPVVVYDDDAEIPF